MSELTPKQKKTLGREPPNNDGQTQRHQWNQNK